MSSGSIIRALRTWSRIRTDTVRFLRPVPPAVGLSRHVWRRRDSNPLPLLCKSSALPSELHPRGPLRASLDCLVNLLGDRDVGENGSVLLAQVVAPEILLTAEGHVEQFVFVAFP